MLFKENSVDREERQRALEGAVSAWHDAEARFPTQRLSAGARANVRALSRRGADAAHAGLERPLARLFLPAGRLAAAAAVPALILAVSFGWMLRGGDQPVGSTIASVSIESSKINGQAVFDIANGGRVHQVYKSTSASEIGRADLFATAAGEFSDELSGSERVVFYRIE